MTSGIIYFVKVCLHRDLWVRRCSSLSFWVSPCPYHYHIYHIEFPPVTIIIIYLECLHACMVFFIMWDFGVTPPVWAASLAVSILLGHGRFSIMNQYESTDYYPIIVNHLSNGQIVAASRHWKECHCLPEWLIVFQIDVDCRSSGLWIVVYPYSYPYTLLCVSRLYHRHVKE